MDSPLLTSSTGPMTTATATATTTQNPSVVPESLANPEWDDVVARIAKRSFALVATSSSAERPHAAGILYAEADGALYVSTVRDSRKGRNIATNPHVSVTVPIRRIPIGPPATAMFQTVARLLDNDDPEIRRLAAAGRIDAITAHGELDLVEGCIVKIEPPRVIHTYGLGIGLWTLIRQPLRGGGRFERP
jgi:Pyridoxamine 5'-phosphate oxidase